MRYRLLSYYGFIRFLNVGNDLLFIDNQTFPDLSSITLMTSPSTDFTIGSTLQFKALGTYFSGSTADITSQVIWTSSDTNIVTISSMGIATGVAPGSANITAALSRLVSQRNLASSALCANRDDYFNDENYFSNPAMTP